MDKPSLRANDIFQIPRERMPLRHPRSEDFNKLLEAVQSIGAHEYHILETGTMRPNDFQSTLFWDEFVNEKGGSVVTIDKDETTSNFARQACTEKVSAITGDSVTALSELAKKGTTEFNVAWLDSYDVTWLAPHESALHHIKELCALLPMMKPPFVIAVDDNKEMQNIWTGKGMYVKDYFDNINAQKITENYVLSWLIT